MTFDAAGAGQAGAFQLPFDQVANGAGIRLDALPDARRLRQFWAVGQTIEHGQRRLEPMRQIADGIAGAFQPAIDQLDETVDFLGLGQADRTARSFTGDHLRQFPVEDDEGFQGPLHEKPLGNQGQADKQPVQHQK